MVKLSLLAWTCLVAQSLAACTNKIVRKEWRNLTDDERNRFITAQQKLWRSEIDPITKKSVYDRNFTILHRESTPGAHRLPAFLPWHRRYLRDYELALRTIDPTVSIPYWNWAEGGINANKALLWDNKYFGGDGQGPDNCVQTGRYANWTLQVGGDMNNRSIDVPHCLRRIWKYGISSPNAVTPPGVLPTNADIAQQIASFSGNFDNFRKWWEDQHGTMHMGIGGFSPNLNGDMTPVENSPNEPVFWLHHAFVDKVWGDFQNSHPDARSAYYGFPDQNLSSLPKDDPIWTEGAKLSDVMKPWGVTVESAFYLDADDYCIAYE